MLPKLKNWNAKDMIKAVSAAVNKDMVYLKAVKVYKVTLHRYVKSNKSPQELVN